MTAKTALAPNTVGALWMLLSGVFFCAMATLIKYTSEGYSPLLQAFYRQFPAFLLMIPMMVRLGPVGLRTPHWKKLTLRGCAAAGGMILTFYAYGRMPLAAANALSFTRALWLVLLAMIVLRERPGPLRIGATAVGFLGVLIMLGPEVGRGMSFGLAPLAALGGAFLMSTSALGVKVISRDTSPAVIMIWASVIGALATLPGALVLWKWPTPLDAVMLGATGGFGLLAQGCYIKGMQVGDASAMAPIDYTRLIILAIIGYLMFGELPTVWVVVGALIVAASTLAITLYEQRRARMARATEALAEAPVA